jgi:hypothetical protein
MFALSTTVIHIIRRFNEYAIPLLLQVVIPDMHLRFHQEDDESALRFKVCLNSFVMSQKTAASLINQRRRLNFPKLWNCRTELRIKGLVVDISARVFGCDQVRCIAITGPEQPYSMRLY